MRNLHIIENFDRESVARLTIFIRRLEFCYSKIFFRFGDYLEEVGVFLCSFGGVGLAAS